MYFDLRMHLYWKKDKNTDKDIIIIYIFFFAVHATFNDFMNSRISTLI